MSHATDTAACVSNRRSTARDVDAKSRSVIVRRRGGRKWRPSAISVLQRASLWRRILSPVGERLDSVMRSRGLEVMQKSEPR